jgi:hypothetical protein
VKFRDGSHAASVARWRCYSVKLRGTLPHSKPKPSD